MLNGFLLKNTEYRSQNTAVEDKNNGVKIQIR
jgi:hypothetical protein